SFHQGGQARTRARKREITTPQKIGKPFVFTHACSTRPASPRSALGEFRMAMRVVGGGVRRRVAKGSTGHMLGCSVAPWAFLGCGTSSKEAPAPPETAKQFMLSVRVAGDGQGTISGGPIQCGSRCSGPVGAGQSPVVLVAEPADDSTVSGWSISGCDGTQCSVAVDRDLTVGIN